MLLLFTSASIVTIYKLYKNEDMYVVWNITKYILKSKKQLLQTKIMILHFHLHLYFIWSFETKNLGFEGHLPFHLMGTK